MAIKLTENAVKEINRIIQERNEPDKKLWDSTSSIGTLAALLRVVNAGPLK